MNINRWTKKRLTMQQAEDEYTGLAFINYVTGGKAKEPIASSRGWLELRPLDEEWKEFINQMVEGDEIWKYRSPERTWKCLGGREYIVIVRKGKSIDMLLTLMN